MAKANFDAALFLFHWLRCFRLSLSMKATCGVASCESMESGTEQLNYSLFPFFINECNKRDNLIKKSVKIICFKSMLMKFFSLQEKSLFTIHNSTGVKDTHSEKGLSNETPTLTKSMNVEIWVVGTSNQLFIRVS